MADMASADSPPAVSWAPLSGLGVLRARGEDAARFLHGQLTQDILELPPNGARLAGFCSAKGRLLASFVLWRPQPDEVLLLCSADLLAATMKRLAMFVLRAKCRLDDASAEYEVQGLWSEGPSHAGGLLPPQAWTTFQPSEAQTTLRLPSAAARSLGLRLLRRAPGQAAGQPPETVEAQVREQSADGFFAAWVEAGLPWVVAATADHFVPQMINFELVGGVNFQKGCYPGQEVVARSQYRGTLKRRLHRFDVDGTARPGQEIFHSLDPAQPAGEVVLAAPAGAGAGAEAAQACGLLAEVKLAALVEGSLHLGAPDGPPLKPMPLPYALPDASSSRVA